MRHLLAVPLSFCLALAAMPARADDPIAMRPLPPGQVQDCAGHQLLRPIMATHTIPPYPQVSVMTDEQGVVLLDVVIGTDGVPSDVQIANSSGSLRLDEAARDFVMSNWKWQPPLNDCKPVAAKTRVSIKWDIKDARPGAAIAGISSSVLLDLMTIKVLGASDYPAGLPPLTKAATAVVMVIVSASGQVTAVPMGGPANPLSARAQELAQSYHWPQSKMDGKAIGAIYGLMLVWPAPGQPVPKANDIKSVMSLLAPAGAPPAPPK